MPSLFTHPLFAGSAAKQSVAKGRACAPSWSQVNPEDEVRSVASVGSVAGYAGSFYERSDPTLDQDLAVAAANKKSGLDNTSATAAVSAPLGALKAAKTVATTPAVANPGPGGEETEVQHNIQLLSHRKTAMLVPVRVHDALSLCSCNCLHGQSSGR
jgi:hypothetical protein